MEHFAGLDVSVKETSVGIVDDTGRVVREAKVSSEPEALLAVLNNPSYRFRRIGLEAGPLSQWLLKSWGLFLRAPLRAVTRHLPRIIAVIMALPPFLLVAIMAHAVTN